MIKLCLDGLDSLPPIGMKKIIVIVLLFIGILILSYLKSKSEGFYDILPLSSVVATNATLVGDELLPKNAICVPRAAGMKSQCKKGLTCVGNPDQYGSCQ